MTSTAEEREGGRVVVPGVGPTDRPLLALIGQCPGKDEVILGQPFVGRAGAELNRFLGRDGLPPRDVCYLDNLVPHRPAGGGETPSVVETEEGVGGVVERLSRIQPRCVVALGAIPAQALCGDIRMERDHGLIFPSAHLSAPVFVAYHPAALLHSPDMASYVAADMEALALAIEADFPLHWSDAITAPVYRPLEEGDVIPQAFSLDTEGSRERPWCLTISWTAGEGYIVRPGDPQMGRVREACGRAERVTCQGLLADLDVLERLGITIPETAMDDTQIMAYLLSLEPIGLKDLAARWLGADQESYADVTREADDLHVTRHLEGLMETHVPPTADIALRFGRSIVGVLDKIADPTDARSARQIWQGCTWSAAFPPIPSVSLDEVRPRQRVVRYACRDADLTERLRPLLFEEIRKRGLEEVYRLDLGVIPMVSRMQHVGMRIDPDHFERVGERIERRYSWALQSIERRIGRPLNPNSGQQVSDLLFGELGLPPTKWTKKRKWRTTEDKFLEAMRSHHPVIPHLIRARELQKIKSAYVWPILRLAREGVIFPHLRITRVVTGRVSSFDPNVLAIPKHSVYGTWIRAGFVAGEGNVLLSNDLSQIELRIMAHQSRDPFLLKVFREGRDPHAELAEQIFGVKAADQDESRHRLPIKKVNFGDIMGITPKGLAEQLGAAGVEWGVDDCRKLLEESRRVKPGVAKWIDRTHAHARRYGWVGDFLGRRRYVGGVRAADERIREAALREAQATPTQSGAQEVFKAWMGEMWRSVFKHRVGGKAGFYCEPWLQVHDDFLCEVDERHAEEIDQEIKACLPQLLRVPVECKGKVGRRWSEV